MIISDIINNIDKYNEDMTVFIAPELPFNPGTKAFVGFIDNNEEYPLEANGMTEFFSVWQIRNILNSQFKKHKIDSPTAIQKFELLYDYIQKIEL